MPYHLRGRVIRAEDETGVPGLEVTVIDSDHQFDDLLGRTRTDADGRFTVTYTEADYALEEVFEREPEIYVRVRDRSGHTLHTDDRARPFPPSAEDRHEITLEADVLGPHESEPLIWDPPDQPPFPPERIDVIERAIGTAIAEPGTDRYEQFRAAALCPAPDFLDIEDLVGTAFGGLRGVPEETRRFRDILDGLHEGGTVDPPEDDYFHATWFDRVRRRTAARALAYREIGADQPPRASIRNEVRSLPDDLQLTKERTTLHSLDSASLDVEGIKGHPTVERALPAMRNAVAEELRSRHAIVEPDAAIILFGASLAVADDLEQRRQYAAVVIDQFRRYRLLTDTFETAEAVLAGDATPERLRTMIRRGAIECGPDDGPIPFPIPERGPDGFGDIIAEDLWWLDCLLDADRAVRTVGRTERYTIEGITPADACAGDTVTITGTGFGSDPGKVIFTGDDGTVRVTPDSWSDSEIVLTLPDEARAGPLSLEIDNGTAEICGKFIVVRRLPTEDSIDTFGGGRPAVSLYVTGRPCVAPGSVLEATWTVRPASATEVTLDVDGVGSFDVSPSGSKRFTVPTTITEPETFEVTVAAETPCGRATSVEELVVNVVPDLDVAGIEVTQGVQRFAIGGTNNNSIATIAGKDTVVRVYVSVDRDGFVGDTAEVTGELRIDGTTLSPRNGSVPTSRTARTAPDPTITAVANPTPAETDHSLNFLVPAALADGTQTLRVTVRGESVCETIPTASDSLTWSWTDNRGLPVRFVRIRDDGPGGTGDRPSRAEARFTIQRAFDLLPSPPTDIGPAWDDTHETNENIGTLGGLGDLLDEIESHRTSNIVAEWVDTRSGLLDLDHLLELAEQHHVGLTTPFCRGLAGGSRACVSCIYDPSHGDGVADADPTTALGNAVFRRVKTAHELGHTLDFDHVQVNCAGATAVVCPSSGCYVHPNGGAMPANVTPFDPFWNGVLLGRTNPPGQVSDFMSYGCARWASPDSWGRLQGDI